MNDDTMSGKQWDDAEDRMHQVETAEAEFFERDPNGFLIALFNRKYPVGSSPVFDLPDGKTVQIKVLKAPRRDGSRVLFFGSDYATGHEADHEIAINSNRWIKLLT